MTKIKRNESEFSDWSTSELQSEFRLSFDEKKLTNYVAEKTKTLAISVEDSDIIDYIKNMGRAEAIKRLQDESEFQKSQQELFQN